MNLMEYVRIIVRRGWIALLLALIAAGGAYVFSQQMTPVYRATQVVLMTPSRSDWGLSQAAAGLLLNHVAYLNSDFVASDIIDRLQLDMLPGQLRGMTTINPNRDNLTIAIEVDMPDLDLAGQVALAWGEELVRYRDELNDLAQREDRIRAALQDNPQLGLLRPNTTVNVMIGGIAGLFLGAIIIFVLEYLESSVIRRRDDLERAGVPVLATVPAE